VVTATQDGAQVAFEGVLVGDVLAKAGVVMGEKLRGGAMARYVLPPRATVHHGVCAGRARPGHQRVGDPHRRPA